MSTDGAAIVNTKTSSTTPTIVPTRNKLDTGIGGNVGEVSLITGGTEALGADASQNVRLGATKRLYMDGGGNTYIVESAADTLQLVTGGTAGLTVDANQLTRRKTTATITADVSSVQGGGLLSANINEISVCANVGDAVTLPVAVAGMEIVIINNGANAADVFPNTGADLGAGANTAASLAAGAAIRYTAFNATTWKAV